MFVLCSLFCSPDSLSGTVCAFVLCVCVCVYNFKDTFQTKDQLIGDGMPKREQKTIFGSVVKGLVLDK